MVGTATNSHGDRAVTACLVDYLHIIANGEPRSMHQASRATGVDWYTVRRLFRGQPRIFRPTSKTRYAKWTLTPVAAKTAAEKAK